MNSSSRWLSVFTDATRFHRQPSATTTQQTSQQQKRIKPTQMDGSDSGYSSNSSSSSTSTSSSTMEMCCDIGNEQYYRKLVRKERRMVLETSYPLNSAWKVIVGSSPVRDFTPVIKLTRDPDAVVGCIDEEVDEEESSVGGKGGSVVIPIEDWDLIIEYLMKSEKFLRDNDCENAEDGEEEEAGGVKHQHQLYPQTIFDFTLSQQIFLDRKCIKIEVDGASSQDDDDDDSEDEDEDQVQCIYLNAESVLTLLSLTPILNSHLSRLNRLGLHEAYNKILIVLAEMSASDEGECEPIFIERFKMISSLLPLEPSVTTAMLEIVRFHAPQLYNDYERHIKAKGLANHPPSVCKSTQ